MSPHDRDDTPPHYKATSRRPKAGGRYAFLVRGMQLYGEYCASDPWTPLALFDDAMTPSQRIRTIRDNASRLNFQCAFEQAEVDGLAAVGVPRDKLARPFTPQVASLVERLARPKIDLLQQHFAGITGPVRAPPHVRVRALVHWIAPMRSAEPRAIWLNEGADGGQGNLTRHHLDRAPNAYARYLWKLRIRELILTVVECDVHELRLLSRIHDAAVKGPRYRGLRGAELAEAIHAKRDLALLLEDCMESTPAVVFRPRAAA